MGEVRGLTLERPHGLEQRPPVAGQAEVRRVHMQGMRQADLLDRRGQPREQQPRREGASGQRRIEIVVIAAAAPPECRAAWIGDLHGPAAASADRVADKSHRLVAIAGVEGVEHVGVVSCQQIDPLVEDRQLGQLPMRDGGRAGGDRSIEDGRVAERGVERTGRLDRGHRRGKVWTAGELRGDPPAQPHLRPRDMAVEIDTPRHHHESRGIDAAEAAGVSRPRHDSAVLDPDVVDGAVAARGRVVEDPAGEHETVRGGARHAEASAAAWISATRG